MRRADSFEKTLMLGKIKGMRRRGWQKMSWLDGVGDGQGGLACCSPWGCKESDTTKRLNWTELNWKRDVMSKADILSMGKAVTFFFFSQWYSPVRKQRGKTIVVVVQSLSHVWLFEMPWTAAKSVQNWDFIKGWPLMGKEERGRVIETEWLKWQTLEPRVEEDESESRKKQTD